MAALRQFVIRGVELRHQPGRPWIVLSLRGDAFVGLDLLAKPIDLLLPLTNLGIGFDGLIDLGIRRRGQRFLLRG